MGTWTRRAVDLLLACTAIGMGVITCGLVYDIAREGEGPYWPTVTVAGQGVSVGGILGMFVIAVTFCALLAARVADRARPAPSGPWGWYCGGIAVLIVVMCALGGGDLVEVLARGLSPALACGAAILLTRHPGEKTGR